MASFKLLLLTGNHYAIIGDPVQAFKYYSYLLKLLEKQFIDSFSVDFLRVYCQAITKSLQLCKEFGMLEYSTKLAERAFDSLTLLLTAIKIEGKDYKKERESKQLESFKLMIITTLYVTQISLEEGDLLRVIDCFKLVRFFVKTCLSSEDEFSHYINLSLKTLAMRASNVLEEEDEFIAIILKRYPEECLNYEAEIRAKRIPAILNFDLAGTIVEKARTTSYKFEGNLGTSHKNLVSSSTYCEPASCNKANEKPKQPQLVFTKTSELKPKEDNDSKNALKYHLNSFVGFAKKQKSKKSQSKEPSSQQDKDKRFLNMDDYFESTMNSKITPQEIPDTSYLKCYDTTFQKERKYWLTKFTVKNTYNNVKAVKVQGKAMDQLIETDFKETKTEIRVVFSHPGVQSQKVYQPGWVF